MEQPPRSQLLPGIPLFSKMDPTLLKNKRDGGGSGFKRNRRGLKKNRAKANDKKLTFVGANCAGLNSKLKSFDNLIRELNPSVIFFTRNQV